MEHDYQRIYHNFITRNIIFAVFLYKDLRRNEKNYLGSVTNFLKRRISQELNLELEVGPKTSKEEERNSAIKSILDDDDDNGVLNLVVVRFKTGVKEVNLQIDLNKEEKYEKYLYEW